ncbi:hypothetical protein DFH05DRAFT_293681 [Lentinula detonsa]|uniref:Uncharacterized protein n=1 Tax=Lentinula detonsa TaxID=2804962 RepID=A0A9W8NWM3_9AGAR|nr:hypothetical protein DFH05DRAFT_293681 [Lentinula detonsa]
MMQNINADSFLTHLQNEIDRFVIGTANEIQHRGRAMRPLGSNVTRPPSPVQCQCLSTCIKHGLFRETMRRGILPFTSILLLLSSLGSAFIPLRLDINMTYSSLQYFQCLSVDTCGHSRQKRGTSSEECRKCHVISGGFSRVKHKLHMDLMGPGGQSHCLRSVILLSDALREGLRPSCCQGIGSIVWCTWCTDSLLRL